MLNLIRTDASNDDFKVLVKELDTYLSSVNGENDDFFRGHNKIDHLNHVVIAYSKGESVGCGAFKVLNKEAVEVKRMFVKPEFRGNRVAFQILEELEKWAEANEFKYVLLETSKDMRPAVQLYKKSGYEVIPNYEPYVNIESSICFRKYL